MPRHRKSPTPISREEALIEAAAVLRANPEATDAEVQDSINVWLQRRESDLQLTITEVARKRVELEIPPSGRKPFQRGLF